MTDGRGIGVLVVTHGELAAELVDAARTIVGPAPHLAPLSIGWDDDVDEARELVRSAIVEHDSGRGVLLLTDMFGGTPTNLCLSFLARKGVEIITGVNLPMVVKTANLTPEQLREMDLRAIAETVASRGRESIRVPGAVLDPEPGGEAD